MRIKSFKEYLFLSSFWHIILVFAVASFTFFGFINQRDLRRKNLKLVNSSVRVDMVAMPKLTLKELKQISMEIDSSSGPSPSKKTGQEKSLNKSDVVLKKAKKKTSFLDMMKGLSKKKIKTKNLKKTKNSNSKSSKNSNSNRKIDRKLNELILAGNKVSKGSSITGNTGGTNGALEDYAIKVRDAVKINWFLPSYLQNQGYRCLIRIYINENGNLIDSKVVESSGSDEFDSKALLSVRKAKLSSPSAEILRDVKGGEIILAFPL